MARFRFTIWRMMAAVAVVAVILPYEKVVLGFIINDRDVDATWAGAAFVFLLCNIPVYLLAWLGYSAATYPRIRIRPRAADAKASGKREIGNAHAAPPR